MYRLLLKKPTKNMNYEKVIIKQIPDDYAIATGLSKYNRSKMPQTTDFFQVAIGNDGRYVTGLDEFGFEVQSITNKEEREKKFEEKKALRESLERLTSRDLGATNETFWSTFGVKISSEQELVLNNNNPMHVIMYHALIANNLVAPDQDTASQPQYLQCKYYCYVESTVDREEVSTQKLKDKAAGKLLELSDTPEKMVLIGQYLEGDKYKKNMKEDSLYKMLSTFVKDAKNPENLRKFLKAVDAGVEELTYKITIDRGIKQRAIVLKDGYYQRGQITLGKSLPEVYSNLKKPEFAMEFMSLQDEVEV